MWGPGIAAPEPNENEPQQDVLQTPLPKQETQGLPLSPVSVILNQPLLFPNLGRLICTVGTLMRSLAI